MTGLLGVAAYFLLLVGVACAFWHVVISWPRGFGHKASAIAVVMFVEFCALSVAR